MKLIRCPNCGAVPSQTIIQVKDHNLYHCTRPLHRLEVHRKEGRIVFKTIPTFCDTVIDDAGMVVKGWISYLTAGYDGLYKPKIKTEVETENIK